MSKFTKKAFIDACREYANSKWGKHRNGELIIHEFMHDLVCTVRGENVVYIPGSPGLMKIWRSFTDRPFTFETLWNLPEE